MGLRGQRAVRFSLTPAAVERRGTGHSPPPGSWQRLVDWIGSVGVPDMAHGL